MTKHVAAENDILKKLWNFGIIPVIKINQLDRTEDLASTLVNAELPCAEITYRTECAGDAIKKIAANHPDILIGAGTVISLDQAKEAVSSGAKFIVSPGLNLAIIDWCLQENITVIPGVATPSDIMAAIDRGVNVLKFFPALALGGINYLNAITPAFPGIRFIPTGGINSGNVATWLELPYIHAIGGSWLVPSDLLETGAFDQIGELIMVSVRIVKSARSEMEAA
jgi:2-dehydro-3-deoxyphosphogluconate aldolase/(4S)-4-hydroxy-2-oxoglutarate aldolase